MKKITLPYLLIFYMLLMAAFVQAQTANWNLIHPKPGLDIIRGIHMKQDGSGVIASEQGVFYTTDEWQTWTKLMNADTIDEKPLIVMKFVDTLIGYLTFNKKLYKTTNGGLQWQQLGNYNFFQLDFVTASIGYGRVGSKLYRTTNGGMSWTLQSDIPLDNEVTVKSATELWRNTFDSYNDTLFVIIFRSTNSGVTWQHVNIGHDISFMNKLQFISDSVGFIYGTKDYLYRTGNGGQNWVKYTVSECAGCLSPLSDILKFDNNNLALFEHNIVYSSSDGGKSWQSTQPQQYCSAIDGTPMAFSSLNNIGYLTYFNKIFKSLDFGQSWADLHEFYCPFKVFSGCFDFNGKIWLATSNGVISTTQVQLAANDLAFENVLIDPTNLYIYDVKFSSPDTGYACSIDRIYRTTNGGATWTTVFETLGFSISPYFYDIQFIPGQIIVVGDRISFRSPNGGNSWFQCHAPIADHIGFQGYGKNMAIGFVKNSSLGFMVKKVSSHTSELYKTTDGITWQLQSATFAPPISGVRKIFCLDSSHIWVMTRHSLYRSVDGGSTWQHLPHNQHWHSKSDLRFISPQIGFASGKSNQPFLTTDGGETWYTAPGTLNASQQTFMLFQGDVPVLTAGLHGTIYLSSDFIPVKTVVIKGSVSRKTHDSCANPTGEKLRYRQFVLEPRGNITVSNENGDFFFTPFPGNYQVRQQFPTYLINPIESQFCPQNNQTVLATIDQSSDTVAIQSFINKVTDCAILNITSVHGPARPCMRGNYLINVQNVGNIPSDPKELVITMPAHLHFVSANYTFTQLDSTYRFTIPAINPGATFSIQIKDSVSCNPNGLTGLIFCIKAELLNPPPCVMESANWDGANLEVASRCVNGKPRFTIRNSGAAMQNALPYRIFINNQLVYEAMFQLAANNQMNINLPANAPEGYVRLETPQTQNHPLATFAAAEANCLNGSSTNGAFLPPIQSPLVDQHCVTITNAYDPNDLQVFPKGVGDIGGIRPGTPLKYLVRFQNTGTDTAFNVVVVDTLTSNFDISSLLLGASSHPYTFELSGTLSKPVLKFRFRNIMLPDSNVNKEGSIGYFSFQVRHRTGAPLGTTLPNFVDIYFDFNDPIRTNSTLNTLWEPTFVSGVIDTVITHSQTPTLHTKDILQIAPNPASNQVVIKVNSVYSGGTITISNLNGKTITTLDGSKNTHEVSVATWPKGIYIVKPAGLAPQKLVIE
jgi:uncharacterized repeat protein (TIGR01451 family)